MWDSDARERLSKLSHQWHQIWFYATINERMARSQTTFPGRSCSFSYSRRGKFFRSNDSFRTFCSGYGEGGPSSPYHRTSNKFTGLVLLFCQPSLSRGSFC
eukprot:Lithocolla_globosa_v1_NODE_3920_length_1550_cov_51.229431.p2 type:complete len:101 gc:universal NODE_3920_length_1550_cov_51.229431:1069-1371(+)